MPDTEVQVHPFSCGTTLAPPVYFKRPPGRLGVPLAVAGALRSGKATWPVLPFPVVLVEHPDAGAFLIDTGPSAKMATGDAREDVGRVGAAFLKVSMSAEETAASQVRALGHDPAAIGLVVMTHLHYDHLGGSDQFPAAEFVVSRAEHDDPPGAKKGTYAHHRDAVSRWRVVDLERDGEPFGPFEHTHDLFGDGAVRLLSTPGHSPGHLSVLLRLPGGRPALITGDAAYDRRAIDERNVPLLCPDVQAYLRSLDALRAYVAEHPESVVVCGHDAERWHIDSAALADASAVTGEPI